MSSTRSRWSTCSRRSGIHKRISASCWSRWRSTARSPPAPWATTPPWPYLSDRPQLLFTYFKQLFAQVSNPPLDAIREELVTSLSINLGAQRNLFEETPLHARQLRLPSPVLTERDLEKIKAVDRPGIKAATLSLLFPADEGPGAMDRAMDALRRGASEAIEAGCTILVLSDRGVGPHHAAIPSLLATAGVHHHLIREGERTKVGIVVESAEPREVAHLALLIGYGAGAVCPYLTLETLEHMRRQGLFPEGMDAAEAEYNYIKATSKGLLKVISKMGISTIHSYHGAQIFEAVGLSQRLVNEYFTWTASRIGGIDTDAIEADVLARHARAFPKVAIDAALDLDPGGFYYWRRDGEYPHVEPGHHHEAAIRQQYQRRPRVPRFRGARQRLRAPPLHTARLARFQDPGPGPFRFTRSSPPSKSSSGSRRAQSPSAPSAARRTNRWQSR